MNTPSLMSNTVTVDSSAEGNCQMEVREGAGRRECLRMAVNLRALFLLVHLLPCALQRTQSLDALTSNLNARRCSVTACIASKHASGSSSRSIESVK